ncbi:MAG TPA: ribbon-helix-helix protein, CopG family [Thermoanaerobaculia bacterium]|nr:ribbon-helix-helix protein, CopG family [Thermoanaerobaculia bacterium]
MPTSVRLDSETTRVLEQLARTKKVSKSDVLRQAIELLAGQDRQRPYERVEDLIGSVEGGRPDLSERTGERLRQLLMDRKR